MSSQQVAHLTPDYNASGCYIGTLLNQGFEVKSLLGKGLVGDVYFAVHPQFPQEKFAIKFLSTKILDDESKRRFIQEIKISAELGKRSAHIVKVKAYGLHNQFVPYYVMELLQGQTLSFLLKKLSNPLDLSRFLSLALQIAEALKIAHQGIYIKGRYYPILHRNLEPSNIFITLDSTGQEFVKVLDYGMAKLVGYDTPLTRTTGQVLGALSYASPEQIQGEKLDHRSDLYSFGILMYQMLNGRIPWDLQRSPLNRNNFRLWYEVHCSQPPLPFDPALNLPPVLQKIVMACLAKEPGHRPLRVTDIIQVLETLQRSSPDPQPKVLPNISLAPSWPQDKPIAKIIFPKTISTQTGKEIGLWMMLPQSEIQQLDLRSSMEIQHGFFVSHFPASLLCWSIAFSLKQGEQRSFVCFLDIDQKSTPLVLNFLLQQQQFKVLVFAMESPSQAHWVQTCSLNPVDLKCLRDFLQHPVDGHSAYQSQMSQSSESQSGQSQSGESQPTELKAAKAKLRLQAQNFFSAPNSTVAGQQSPSEPMEEPQILESKSAKSVKSTESMMTIRNLFNLVFSSIRSFPQGLRAFFQ